MNVLVVDDEPMMRELYLTIFDWEGNGFHLAGVAHDGLKALEYMRKTQIDAVITDIKMPVMSGIELIKQARLEFPDTKFIVMSGYNDYSLVREAFKLGAVDYFLKSEMEPDYVITMLLNIKKQLEESRKSTDDFSTNRTKLSDEKYTNMLREKLIKELIWSAGSAKTLTQLSDMGIYLDIKSMGVMVLSFVDYFAVEDNIWKGERETFKYAVINVLNELCTKYGNVYPVYNLPNEYLILLSTKDNVNIKELFRDISNASTQYFSIVCNCGYSEKCNDRDNLETTYRQAKNACDYCFVLGNGSLVKYSDIQYLGKEQDFSVNIKEMRQALLHSKSEKLVNVIPKVRIQSGSVNLRQVEDIKKLFEMYYLEMVRFIEENSLPPKACQCVFEFDKIKSKADLAGYNKWMTDSVNSLAEALANGSKIDKAKQYIRHHYNETLTLHTVAEHVGISEGYLSRLFQQTEGYGFSQYLIMTRIEVAKNLLTTTNLKIYEVAQEVGYPNVGQFARMFKKVVGVSPKAFMK